MPHKDDKNDVELAESASKGSHENNHHHEEVEECALIEDTRTIMVG